MPVDLLENRARRLLRHTLAPRALAKLLPVQRNQMLVVPLGKRTPDLVRLRRRQPRHIRDQLHHLLLPHNDPVPPRQRPLLQRMIIRPLRTVPVPLHKLRHRAPLHPHPRPDQRHLVRQVQQIAREQTLPHLQLRRRLQQEYPLRQTGVDHVVHLWILRIDPAQIRPPPLPRLHQIQRLLQLIQHRQRQDVDLRKTRVRHTVLVPVHDEPALHRPRPHRNHLRNRRTAQYHPPHMLAQQLRRSHQLRPKLDQLPPPARIHPLAERRQLLHLLPQTPRIMRTHLLRKQAQLLLRQSQRLAQVLQHPLDLVRENRPRQHRIRRPEPLMHPLDQLVPQRPRKIKVNVRQHRHLRR